MSDAFLDKIRDYDFYTGDKSIDKQISVTELSLGEILPIYLSRITTELKPQKLGQHTLGSIAHLGLNVLAEKFGLTPGYRLENKLFNGYILTGEPDVLDQKNKIIYDFKLSKVYAHKQSVAKTVSHQYWKQLNYYRILLGGDWTMKLIWGLKDQGSRDDFDEAIVTQTVSKINDDHLINYAINMSNKLQLALDGEISAPRKCNDTWRDLKCKMYCDYNHVCDYGKTLIEIKKGTGLVL